MDAGSMNQFRMLVKDQNSITSIVAILHHQILLATQKKDTGGVEKKKTFCANDAVDYKYRFVNYSIGHYFNQYKSEAREKFQ